MGALNDGPAGAGTWDATMVTERLAVDPEMSFVHALLASGGRDLEYCYQCATCTVVCPITPDGTPFPRKEMIFAQWGVKEKLLRSLDSWLCIHCNDCSSHCPRGAKPGDVMAAIRALSVQYYSFPAFLARAASTPSRIWLLFLIPIVIIGAVIMGLHGAAGFAFLGGEVVFSKMLPVPAIDAIFLPACVFAGVTALVGLWRFIGAMRREYPRTENGEPLAAAVVGAAKDIFSHSKFRDCDENRGRNGAHLLAMYGFIGLFITTTAVAALYYFDRFGLEVATTPLDFFHPVKILGNVSGTMLMLACVLIVARRLDSARVGTNNFFDWTFVWILFLTVITGFLSQLGRVFAPAAAAYLAYYIHLVLVFFLLAYAPHTKFAHLFFRTASMIYARYAGRNIVLPVTNGGAGVREGGGTA